MKNFANFRLSFVLVLCLISTLAQAQVRPKAAVPDGYWNVETNLTTRDYTIVRFYTNQDNLVYEERLPGVCLDLGGRTGRRRHLTRSLNTALRQVLQNPTRQPSAPLAQQFGPRRARPLYAAR